jgi:hypothetical protein
MPRPGPPIHHSGMRFRSPRDAALHVERNAVLWPGADERFAGYGVMGLPFSSGHYLALRHMAASSIGLGHRTIWHCAPDGRWTFIADATPGASCARYFASDTAQTVHREIDISWDGPHSLRIFVPDLLEWRMELTETPATKLMSSLGGRMPTAAWRSHLLRRFLARAAGPLLGTGRLRLDGTAVNGQRFAAAPKLVWAVSGSTAVLDGVDLGSPHPLPRQLRLGDFLLPQRGLFAIADAAFADPSTPKASVPQQ